MIFWNFHFFITFRYFFRTTLLQFCESKSRLYFASFGCSHRAITSPTQVRAYDHKSLLLFPFRTSLLSHLLVGIRLCCPPLLSPAKEDPFWVPTCGHLHVLALLLSGIHLLPQHPISLFHPPVHGGYIYFNCFMADHTALLSRAFKYIRVCLINIIWYGLWQNVIITRIV